MIKGISTAATLTIVALGILVVLDTPRTTFAVITNTSTIVGWLAPDATHWNNGIPVLIGAFVGVTMVSLFARFLQLKNIGAFALSGLLIGSLLGILSLGGATSGNYVPFGLVIIAGMDLVLYFWGGGD